jgi:hypothetical protein
MTEQELAAIEKRANERKTAHQIDAVEAMAKSQADVPALVAEVRRLKELVRLAYLEGVWSQTHPEFANADQLWLQSDAKASLGGGA